MSVPAYRSPGRRTPLRLPLVLVGLSLVLTGCAAPSPSADNPAGVLIKTGPDDGWNGAVLDQPYTEPTLTLTDTGGAAFDLAADTTAPVTVVFFGYTHCPDVCNTVLAGLASALRRAEPAVRESVEVVFVTTDPARDDPARIRDYLDRFDPSFVGLTAPLPTVERAAEALGVALTGTSKLPGGGYDVGHGAQLIGFDRDGKGWIIWTPGTPVDDLRADLTRMATPA